MLNEKATDAAALERGSERSELPSDDHQTVHFVVGIGASAGGLESLEKLFRKLPTNTGMAFVVLQHLSPDFKSMMLELLGRDTSMPIHRAEDGMLVEADSVYLLPPKKEMVIEGGRLRLTDKDRNKGLALPIDLFLESLARECGSKAVAIILSGSGSDGSRGVIEIARHGGFVISESPETAKFDGMPASAQAAGVVDEILTPEQIGEFLVRMATEPSLSRKERRALDIVRQDALQGMEAIYQLFRRVYDIDFSVYKDTTVLRRVHRRLAMLGISNVDEYAAKLQSDPAELNALYSDLLIGVTQFFRDSDTFESLRKTIFPEIVDRCQPNQPLRAWIAACATGEEAYSMAIVIHEVFEAAGKTPRLKLFATDVHKASLEHAGRGVYQFSVLKGMSEERLRKYFVQRETGFQVSPEIRKSIVFAPHNVLSDAPFTDLDFVSCRNLLIYFQPVAQTRALSMFHFALNKGGVLVLGGSESPGELAAEFDVVNERYRIYRKRRQIRLPNEFRTPLERPSSADLHASPVRVGVAARRAPSEQQTLQDQLLNRFMPPSLLIDENRHLVDSFGGAEKFLRLQARHPSLDVLDLMGESLRTTLAGAIARAQADNTTVRFSNILLRNDEAEFPFNLTVTPISHVSISGKHLLVSFEPLGAPPVRAEEPAENMPGELDASRDHIRQLEDDLRYSRENLQATIEELETSNEELQATNEELIASNEELQSTNEELHSVNEELYTVNAEHQRKIDELAELNRDMNHLLENTDVATVFLDKELRVRRFTSRVKRVFDLVEHDIGRSIESFLPKFSIDGLVARLREVVATNEPQECVALSNDGTTYLLRMLPYRAQHSFEGVVLMLVDVSSLEALRERLCWISAIVDSTEDAIIGQDLTGIITSWNGGAERLYGYSAKEAIGQTVAMLVPEERRSEILDYHAAIASGERLHTRDTIRVRKDGSELHVSLTVSPVRDSQNRLIGISKIARDVSERVAMENEIRRQVEQRESFLATLSHELRNPLNAALNASRVIRDPRTDDETRNQAAEIIERQISMTRTLLVDLLDVSRISRGKIDLKLETLDLRSLVGMVQETTQAELQRYSQRVIWKLPDCSVPVSGDATRLVQVQVNLIHNAAKYSPRDSEISVTIDREGDWGIISVSDRGSGIPSDQLERIFEPFVQVGQTRDQSDGGIGVGLTLVRMLVEKHGGKVAAHSDGNGKGSTFQVRLPIADSRSQSDTEARPTPASHTRPDDRKEKRSIVLIEDVADSRMMLTSLLRLEGHEVNAYGDGESGLEAIVQQCPDLALVDIGLPGIHGYEVARLARANARGRNTTLIALTGYGQPSDIEAALAAGFDGHLIKPIDPDRLMKLIQEKTEASRTE